MFSLTRLTRFQLAWGCNLTGLRWTASLSNHLPAFIFQWPWLGRSPRLEHSQVLLEGGLDVSLVSVMQLLSVILKVIFLIKTLSD